MRSQDGLMNNMNGWEKGDPVARLRGMHIVCGIYIPVAICTYIVVFDMLQILVTALTWVWVRMAV